MGSGSAVRRGGGGIGANRLLVGGEVGAASPRFEMGFRVLVSRGGGGGLGGWGGGVVGGRSWGFREEALVVCVGLMSGCEVKVETVWLGRMHNRVRAGVLCFEACRGICCG